MVPLVGASVGRFDVHDEFIDMRQVSNELVNVVCHADRIRCS